MEIKNSGRTHKAITNIFYNILNQMVMLFLSFISRSVFIWGFGIEYLGINGLFADILNLLSLADLGFNTAMTYSFYKPLAEKDYEKIAGLVNFYKKVYYLIALGIAIIGIALIPFLPRLINVEYEIPHLTIYYLLSLSTVVASYLCIYKTTILMADQKGYLVTKVAIYTNFIKTILQIISIIVWKNYIIFLSVGTIITIGNNVYASRIADKTYQFINKKSTISNYEKKHIFNNLGSVFLYKVSAMLLNATDNILISILISTAMVGYYSNYLLLQTKIVAIISLVFTSMTASIGNLIVTENSEKRFKVFKCEQSISCFICGIVVPCYILLADDFIRIWLGSEYQLGFAMSCAVGLNMYLSCVMQTLWSYREATGLYRKTKWIMVICAMINIGLSIILGKTIGVIGIILASAIARIVTYVWYEPQILFREYFANSEKGYYVQLIKNIFLIIVLVVLGKQFEKVFFVSGYGTWILKASVLGAGFVLVTYLFYRNSEGVNYIRKKIKR